MDQARQVLTPYLDIDYYYSHNPDLDPAKVDAVDHYWLYGWRERRNPCDWFSTGRYLNHHSDVAEAGVNPFLHYILLGKAEGRRIWAAKQRGSEELELSSNATFVSDPHLRDLIDFPSKPASPRLTPFHPKCLDIHWLVPDFSIGSGGHMTIFRLIRWLEISGHICTVWINNPNQDRHSGFEIYDEIVKSFQHINARVLLATEGFSDAQGDAVIATGWQTVARVMNTTGFRERFYLVQDYEPSFHPVGSYSLAAEWTYSQDIACICASPWLAKILNERYGRWTRHFWLAYDSSLYYPVPHRVEEKGEPRIALYARRSTARRAVEMAFLALEHLAGQGYRFHVDVFGDVIDEISAAFPCTAHGIAAPEKLGELYRRSSVGLCFSTTNYSLVPQEMMACGLPVVEIDRESTRAIFPADVVTFTGPHPLKIAADLRQLLSDWTRRRQQADAAMRWVTQFSWERSAKDVEQAILERIQNPGAGRRRLRKTARSRSGNIGATPRNQIKVSVCIPTFNGGPLLARVIDRVREQRTPWRFEIVIVDSSSSDGSIELLQASVLKHGQKHEHGRLRVHKIAQVLFQHGRTRNLCVALARGEFVAFLTQDALPADEFWLYNLVCLLERFPNAAGAFGRHLPWPEATPFTQREINEHFASFLELPIAVSRETNPTRWENEDPAWRSMLRFFSDNNSCLRKKVWKQIPYPEVPYGEDQMWANEVIELGYQKVYVPSAIVYHSHDYTPAELAKRAETEAYFFATTFGQQLYDINRSFDEQLREVRDGDRRWAIENGLSDTAVERRMIENKATLIGRAHGVERARLRTHSCDSQIG